MKEEFYIDLIQKDLIDHLDERQKKQLEDWKNEDPSHRILADNLYMAWELGEHYGDHIEVDLEKDFRQVQSKIKGTKKIVNLRWQWIAIAASFVVMVAAFFLLNPSQPIIIDAKEPNFVHLLPDGSKVSMDEGSRIMYVPNWDGDRIIQFEGSARFEVINRERQIFRVESTNISATVLGTTFFMRDGDDVENTSVQLIEGKLEVKLNDNLPGEILEAGEQVILSNQDQLIKLDYLKTRDFAWNRQKFGFNATTLDEVSRSLSQYYGVRIQVDPGIGDCAFTGEFPTESLALILESISAVFGSDLTRSGDNYVLQGGSCQ